MPDEYNPFKNLTKQTKKANKAAVPEPEPTPPGDDFAKAMQDVRSLDDPRGKQRVKDEPAKEEGLYNPFGDLAQRVENRPEPKDEQSPKPKKAKPVKPKPEPEPEQPEDEQTFLAAMQGVAPLSGKGRSVAPVTAKAPAKRDDHDEDAEVMAKLGRLVSDGIEFNLEFTEEYMHGKVKGLDSHVFQKLKNGRLSCEAHIDLHGLNVEQAGFVLIDFIRDQYLKGSRCVLVVHGRGMNSPAGRSVLKHEVQRWLTRDPLRRVVLAFVTALPRHGGAGAIYVLLRKYKKNGGKIMWDRLPPDLSYPV